MSWSSRKRTSYAAGVTLFFGLLVGVPLFYWYFTIPPTCDDGKRNQGETTVDRGGPCLLLDERQLSPSATLWTRSFRVRDGTYNSIAYIQNPNEQAGVREVGYRFGLYDERNILVAERFGNTYIMPGGVTPIFEGGIDTGQRIVTHTYFEFTKPLVWVRMEAPSNAIIMNDRKIEDETTLPRLLASATNSSVRSISDVAFVAVISDPAGNAFAVSKTTVHELSGGQKIEVAFTWPGPFNVTIGRIDVIPLVAPEEVL